MKKLYLISVVCVLLSSCSKDVMDRTIFIPDERDRELPAYTEWGYNSFGAEYERDYFLVSNQIDPCKIVYNNSQLQFSLHGTDHFGKMTLVFTFPCQEAKDFKDLMQLQGEKIDLSDSLCTVKILHDNIESVIDVLEGELYFKRAQLLSIDEKVNRVILSGTFELRFMKGEFPSYISNGRFDLGITKNVFYSR